MAISVILTIGTTDYDVSSYVIRDSIEIDEYLFNDSFRPNTNSAKLVLSRSCPYIDEIFAAVDDIKIAISNDGVAAFTGYLTQTHELAITCWGGADVPLAAEDPGIKLLKRPWVSTDGLATRFLGKKVCDPADTSNSFVHILAALAGATLGTMPTIPGMVYFSVEDKDKKQYWDILQDVLYDFLYTFYFDQTGKLCLYSLAALQGAPTKTVRTDGTVLQKSIGDKAVTVKKRLIQYNKAVVSFGETETVASQTVFRDTTGGDAVYECNIAIAAGGYYPAGADADTYAFVDYSLDDGREVLSVGSITADFSLDAGIIYELTNLGKSARIRFYNSGTITRYIRKLKIIGTNVVAVKAQSKMTSLAGGSKELAYDAKYLHTTDDASKLANLLRYIHANAQATYSFRAYNGVLYPSDSLYPSETLYPLGDLLALGAIVNLKDPLWTGLDINCAIYRKRYTLGKAGSMFDALGIGAINLADATVCLPVAQTPSTPITAIYPAQKPLTSLTDIVDFNGQYGIYEGQRYRGTMPNTWTLDDAGQTAAQAQAIAAEFAPSYLGKYNASHPANPPNGAWWLVYDNDDSPITRGVWYNNAGTNTRITTSSSAELQAKLIYALADIAWAEKNGYGTAVNYGGFDAFFNALGAVTAFIQELFANNILATGSIAMGSGANMFKAGPDGIHLGAAAFADAPFRVSMAGNLIAANAVIYGTINDVDADQLLPTFTHRHREEIPGVYQWAVPEHVKWVRVTLQGGGGGGASGPDQDGTGNSGGDGGFSAFGNYINVEKGYGGRWDGTIPRVGTRGASSTMDSNVAAYLGGRNGTDGQFGTVFTGGQGGIAGDPIGLYNDIVEKTNLADGLLIFWFGPAALGVNNHDGNNGYPGNGGAGGGNLALSEVMGGPGGGAGATRQILLKLNETYGQYIQIIVGAGGAGGAAIGVGKKGGNGGAGRMLIEY